MPPAHAIPIPIPDDPARPGCSGFCRACGREHSLPMAPALAEARELMAALGRHGRIDLASPIAMAESRFSTASLFGLARGKMFGVLTGQDRDGAPVSVRAFSGQYNGVWRVEGWAGPLFDLAAFSEVHDREEPEIKGLSREIAALAPTSSRAETLRRQRKIRSQRLMAAIHGLYRTRNFRGQHRSLTEIFPPGQGIPTGTGDCCAPKLIAHAARMGWIPLGLAEFYWGRENASTSREHGRFYPSCRGKCYPLLGFMLCGLDRHG